MSCNVAVLMTDTPPETEQWCQEGRPQTTLIKVTAGWSLSHLAPARTESAGVPGALNKQNKFITLNNYAGKQEEARRDLLGAFGGLLREVVVGVVSLSDATEQHSHHTWREGPQTHTHPSQRHHTNTHHFHIKNKRSNIWNFEAKRFFSHTYCGRCFLDVMPWDPYCAIISSDHVMHICCVICILIPTMFD